MDTLAADTDVGIRVLTLVEKEIEEAHEAGVLTAGDGQKPGVRRVNRDVRGDSEPVTLVDFERLVQSRVDAHPEPNNVPFFIAGRVVQVGAHVRETCAYRHAVD